MAEVEVAPVSYEDLALIEEEFAEVDDEIQRKQHELSKPLYAKRAEAVSKIPNFWPLVMEQAPMEIEDYITRARLCNLCRAPHKPDRHAARAGRRKIRKP
ncbi:hypothetical protein BTJ68_14257 [Hortaea werneckii EXF-2000]|uniref:Uncharacterized protein n=1 Tax=Hortaea werneckii EXF-2000 TaxID=1157616 RepID=A0A1Z5SNY4_HORWE|nr:hypothetical protein BTJ68_14257 [Hortaea werneckii EXF-2000]